MWKWLRDTMSKRYFAEETLHRKTLHRKYTTSNKHNSETQLSLSMHKSINSI